MPDARRVKCKDCGRRVEETGPLSWNGLCGPCGEGRVVLSGVQLRNKRGPLYDKWLTATIAGTLGVPVSSLVKER